MNKSTGFTLLEAIVALVLFSSTAMVLLDWLNTNLITLKRIQEQHYRREATRTALTFMENINPTAQPKGTATLDTYHIEWQAELLKEPRPGRNTVGNFSVFEISLYDNHITVKTPEHNLLAQFTLRQTGFKIIHQLNDDDDF